MTRFIESFATQQLLPPWASTGVRTWVFALPLPEGNLENFLDQYMNAGQDERSDILPAPYHYTPRSRGQQYAFLVIADHQEGAMHIPDPNPKHDPVPQYGAFTSIVVGLTVPALRRPWPSTSDIAAERVWVQPFTACNSSTWVFSAREIWGIDAQKMKIDIVESPPDIELHLDASYIGIAHFDFNSVNEMLAALHVEVGAITPGDDVGRPPVARHLSGLIDELSGQAHGASILIESLKEFRSTVDLDLAIYRALVSSQQTLSNVSPVIYHPAVAVDFMWTDGMKEVVKFLGLEQGCGPPPPHTCIRPPLPAQPGDAPTQPRWALNRCQATVKHCVAFTADLTFEVRDTLHVYQPIPLVYQR